VEAGGEVGAWGRDAAVGIGRPQDNVLGIQGVYRKNSSGRRFVLRRGQTRVGSVFLTVAGTDCILL